MIDRHDKDDSSLELAKNVRSFINLNIFHRYMIYFIKPTVLPLQWTSTVLRKY